MAKTETIDLAALKELLLWCRKEGIALSQVSMGGIAVVCADLQVTKHLPRPKLAETAPESGSREDVLARWGGDALKTMMERTVTGQTAEETATYEDDDD